jgi:nucleoside 2-deoxyribosyltransferase
MSFDEEDLKEIYERCIYSLLKDELGFNPIVIKDEHFESEKTINDAMVASIKKSKFVIADFTKQKRNVYFEAGYAAGLGLKVIYTCNEEYFRDKIDINKQSAFDTNHFPHIIWKDKEDLKKQLKDKIEAYIY